MPIPTITDTFTPDLYEKGCEFCGAKIPAQDFNGLEHAHILSGSYAPEQRWNIMILCGSCHHILDKVVKPRILAALRIAATGHHASPQNLGDPKFIAAITWPELVARLDSEVARKNPLPLIDTSKTEWSARHPTLAWQRSPADIR